MKEIIKNMNTDVLAFALWFATVASGTAVMLAVRIALSYFGY